MATSTDLGKLLWFDSATFAKTQIALYGWRCRQYNGWQKSAKQRCYMFIRLLPCGSRTQVSSYLSFSSLYQPLSSP